MKLEMISPREAILLEDIEVSDHIVKAGFKFDGASIPRAFWWLIGSPFTGKYRKAALLHDALYAAELYEREVCDNKFDEVMEKDGVNWFKRNTMWLAVRAGGGFVWSKHTKESINKARKYIRRLK